MRSKTHGQARLLTGLLATIALGAILTVGVATQDGGVFLAVEPSLAQVPLNQSRSSIRGRLTGIDFQRLVAARSDVGRADIQAPALTLNLFDDVLLSAVIEQTTPTSSGYTLSGRIAGTELGTVTLVVNGTVVVGTVQTPSATFTIRTVTPGVYAIREIDTAQLPPGAEPVLPPAITPRSDRIQPIGPPELETDVPPSVTESFDRQQDDGSKVDVIVFYTPDARREEGGDDEVEALIDLMVAETNQAYAATGIIHRLNLTHKQEIDYRESGDMYLDLDRLENKWDGHMDEVHVLRDQYAADLVHLVTDDSDSSLCGIAALGGWYDNWADYMGFGATVSECGSSTFAHEVGHNIGLLHDRYVVDNYDDSNAYGFGYVNQRAFDSDAPKSSRWRTIMAYSKQCSDAGFYCPEVLYFSTPDWTYKGDRLGVPGSTVTSSNTGPSNASRRLNDARVHVARYRNGLCVRAEPTTRISIQAQSGHYLAAELNGGSVIHANRERPGLWETFHVAGTNLGQCLVSGDTVSIYTSDGFYWRVEGGGGTTLDVTARRAAAWEQFVIRRAGGGVIGPGDGVTLQTPTGHYVVAEGGGGSVVNANRVRGGPWETLYISLH